MQYTASSFGAPLLNAFGAVAAPRPNRTADAFTTDPRDKILMLLVMPGWAGIRRMAGALRPLQQGRVTRYLLYIIVTVLLLLTNLFVSVVRGR
jgi:fumarate reductase subunit D